MCRNGGKEDEWVKEVVLETALVLGARYKKKKVDSSFFSFLLFRHSLQKKNEHNWNLLPTFFRIYTRS